MAKVAKTTKKAPTKRKRKPGPMVPELWVLNPETGDVDKVFQKGDNCTSFEYDPESVTPCFKIYYGKFTVTTVGIPYSIVKPLN